MNTPSIIKVVGVFLAGVIVVLGGALIYSRTREPRYPVQAIQSAPVVQQSPAAAESQTPAVKQDPPKRVKQAPAQIAEAAPSPQVSQSQIAQTAEPTNARLENLQSTPPAITKPTAPDPPPALPQTPQSAPPAPLPQSASTASPTAPPPYQATLQPGAPVTIQVREMLSSDRNRAGDVFRGTLDSPLVVNGFTLADQGATVLGKVVNAQKAKLLGSASDLTLVLTEITTKDGQLTRVETNPWDEEGSKIKLRDAPKVAIGAAYGAAVGAVSGAAKGAGVGEAYDRDDKSESVGMNQKVVVIPIGSRLTFHLASPVKVTEKR